MPMARVAGGDIHYTIAGHGSPATLLLPQSSGPLGPEAFADALARRFTILRYDQRGTGRSAPVAASDDYSMAARATEVAGLLDALDIAQTHLVCHSTGCGIGLAFAGAHPGRVGGLVLVSPWAHADRHLMTMQTLRIAAARTLDPYSYAWFNASLLFPPDYRRAHETGFERIAATATPQDAEVIARRLAAILAFDARPIAAALACPVLTVSAADDQLMPAWFGRELAELVSGARHIELPGGGHMLPETQGPLLAEEVADFLASIDARPLR